MIIVTLYVVYDLIPGKPVGGRRHRRRPAVAWSPFKVLIPLSLSFC